MYKSPIDMLVADIQHQIAQQQDEKVYKAVVSVGINVDKEELLRALKYDRDQYNRGHLDGYADAMAEVVRCKDCKWRNTRGCPYMNFNSSERDDLDFCSDGERKDND